MLAGINAPRPGGASGKEMNAPYSAAEQVQEEIEDAALDCEYGM